MLHLLVSVDITWVVIGGLPKVLGVAPDLVGKTGSFIAAAPIHAPFQGWHQKIPWSLPLELQKKQKKKTSRSHSPPEIAVDLIIENPHFEGASLDVATWVLEKQAN